MKCWISGEDRREGNNKKGGHCDPATTQVL